MLPSRQHLPEQVHHDKDDDRLDPLPCVVLFLVDWRRISAIPVWPDRPLALGDQAPDLVLEDLQGVIVLIGSQSIVQRPLLVVGENCVGLSGLGELRASSLVLVPVRVVLESYPPERGLDLGLGGGPRHPKESVEAFLRQGYPSAILVAPTPPLILGSHYAFRSRAFLPFQWCVQVLSDHLSQLGHLFLDVLLLNRHLCPLCLIDWSGAPGAV